MESPQQGKQPFLGLSWCHSSLDEFIIPISAFKTSHWPIIMGHWEAAVVLTGAKFIKSWCWMDYYQGILLETKVHLLSGSPWNYYRDPLGESSNILSFLGCFWINDASHHLCSMGITLEFYVSWGKRLPTSSLIWLSNHQPGINLWLQKCSKWLKQWYLLIAHVYAIDASICFHVFPIAKQLCWGIDVEIAGVCNDHIDNKHICHLRLFHLPGTLLFHSIWDDRNCKHCVGVYLESEWDRSGRERKPSEGKCIFILQLLKDTFIQANYRLLCGQITIWTWAFQLPAEDVRTSERYYGLISSRNRKKHIKWLRIRLAITSKQQHLQGKFRGGFTLKMLFHLRFKSHWPIHLDKWKRFISGKNWVQNRYMINPKSFATHLEVVCQHLKREPISVPCIAILQTSIL